MGLHQWSVALLIGAQLRAPEWVLMGALLRWRLVQ